MKISSAVLVIGLALQLASSSVLARAEQDLYHDEDDVLRLKHDTFKPIVFGGNKDVTHVVQFYNTFCGHCQMFAPIYKELATRARNWTSVVRIAGIDCSKDDNVPTCSESRIDGYPSIFIYPPNAKSLDSKGDEPVNLRSLNIEWTLDDIEETIITYISNLTTTRKEHHPLVSEAMQPLTISNLKELKRIYPADKAGFDLVNDFETQQDLLFIVESDTSFLGRKLMIEFYRIHSKVEIRRVLLSNKALLKNVLSSSDYTNLKNIQPLLVKVHDKDDTTKAQVLVRGEADHILPTLEDSERQDFILNRFRTFLEQYYYEELKEAGGYPPYKTNTFTSKKPITMDVDVAGRHGSELDLYHLVHHNPDTMGRIFAVDLCKSISYMITHEIRIKGALKPVEFATVRNLLTILKKFLPLEKWDATLGKFISDLRTRLDESRMTYEKNGMTGQEWSDLLTWTGADTIRLRYSRENWVSCFDSNRQHKGYTCSLWLLFHTLTVGEYTRAAPVRSRSTLVLNTMRDYIIQFLGCTVCSTNFKRETEHLDSSLTARNSSVIWLWRTHNSVNQRLNNEKQQEQRKPLARVIFPRPERCPTCYKTPTDEIGVDGRTLNDIEWHLRTVFDLITETYSPDSVVTSIEMAQMLKRQRGRVNYDQIQAELDDDNQRAIVRPDMNRSIEQWKLQSFFSNSDIGLCLFLYFLCIVIGALVCFFLNPKLWASSGKLK